MTACDQIKRWQDSSFIYLLLLYRDYNTATEWLRRDREVIESSGPTGLRLEHWRLFKVNIDSASQKFSTWREKHSYVSKEVAWFTRVQCKNNYPIPVCLKSGVGKLLAQRAALEKMLKPRAAPLGKAKQKKGHHLEQIQKVLVGGCNFELGWMLTKYKDVETFKLGNERKYTFW